MKFLANGKEAPTEPGTEDFYLAAINREVRRSWVN
jgi:hypothetical protein